MLEFMKKAVPPNKDQTTSKVIFFFGEGANPKLRLLRDGLNQLGFDPEELLQHGHRRTIYGVYLIANATNYLLSKEKEPEYIFDLRKIKKKYYGYC